MHAYFYLLKEVEIQAFTHSLDPFIATPHCFPAGIANRAVRNDPDSLV